MAHTRESAVPRPLLRLLVALFLANAAVSAWGNLRLYATSGNPGLLPAGSDSVVRVGQIRAGGPAAALRVGEEILALNGRGLRRQHDFWAFFAGRPPGPYTATVRAEGRPRVLALEAPRYEWGWSVSFALGRLAVHLLFAFSGLVLFLLRPEGKAGLLLALAFTLFLPGDLLSYVPEAIGPVAGGLILLCEFLGFLFWPVFLHFLLVFPQPSTLVRRFPVVERLLYLPTLAAMLASAPVFLLRLWQPDLAFAVMQDADWFPWATGGLWLGSTLLGLAALVTSYVQSSGPARRKLRVAVVGTVAGTLPLLLLLGMGALIDPRTIPVEVFRVLAFAALVTLPLVPLAFGYAILRHQVIPVRTLLRRGLRYLLVSRGVVLLEGLLVVGLVAYALSGARGRFVDGLGPRADIVVALIVGAFGMLGLHRFNRALRMAIDRRFFRETYDVRRVLTSLSESVREVPNAEALVDLVAGRVRDALHPESVSVFVREGDGEAFALAHPRSPGPPTSAPAALVGRLSGMDHVLAFDHTEPGPDGAVLAFAMRGRRELMGVLTLGARLGDLPYSREDRELLRSVASQAGLSLENGGLIRRVAEQEKVAHELGIAAEVQRRLFPDRPPVSRGLELSGVCVPAGDVGGDYYDFLELGEGRLGFAVADVAGKGLPAALLMSMVQASLRSQAMGDRSLDEVCSSMNRLLFRSTAPNAYATFFYGVFEEGGRRLRYVNAGHNPPLVIRAGSAREGGALRASEAGAGVGALAVAASAGPTPLAATDRLRATGLVLGALAESPYEEATLDLCPGDIVLAYTDGVSEAFGPGGEEFGEERLAAAVTGSADPSASAILERVTRAVSAWRGAAPAHDDLTLVVARVL